MGLDPYAKQYVTVCSTDTQYYGTASLYMVHHHPQCINTTLYVLVLLLLVRARGPTSCPWTLHLLTSSSLTCSSCSPGPDPSQYSVSLYTYLASVPCCTYYIVRILLVHRYPYIAAAYMAMALQHAPLLCTVCRHHLPSHRLMSLWMWGAVHPYLWIMTYGSGSICQAVCYSV